jgi:hypothetical protein
MTEPTMPEHVYHLAVVAWDRRSARAASGDIEPPLRAAVEVAYRAGRNRGSDIIDAAIAYVTEPDGSDQVEHYWWQLKDAVGTYVKAHADG